MIRCSLTEGLGNHGNVNTAWWRFESLLSHLPEEYGLVVFLALGDYEGTCDGIVALDVTVILGSASRNKKKTQIAQGIAAAAS